MSKPLGRGVYKQKDFNNGEPMIQKNIQANRPSGVSSDEASDETLVMLTLAGDGAAYEALVTRHQHAVIASALAVTHSRFMAEDAAQDAFVTAWIKLNTLQKPERYGAWVCRIARNCGVNMVMRYRSFADFDTVANTEAVSDPGLNPAELYMKSETNNDVRRILSKLPPRVGEIIRLYYMEEMSVGEIAERLGITQGTVKGQLYDGRHKLRKELCAMDERWNDTLVQKVMKKVEELKLWQYRNDKSGVEEVYADVLREVEELPESHRKYHALADVLMRGGGGFPGRKTMPCLSESVMRPSVG